MLVANKRRPLFGAPPLDDVRGPIDPGMSLPYDPRTAPGAVPDQPYPGVTTPPGVSAVPVSGNAAAIAPSNAPLTQPQSVLGDLANINPMIRKPHAFEPGGIGRNIIGGIGDALATWSGGQANFAQGQMLKQREAMAEAQANRARAAEYAEWVNKQEYDAAHPKPANNDTANDYQFWLNTFGPQAAEQWKNNQLDPIIPIRNPDGTVTPVRRSQMSGATGGPQVGEVVDGYRYKGGDKNDPKAWEAVGGPTPSASGTFR